MTLVLQEWPRHHSLMKLQFGKEMTTFEAVVNQRVIVEVNQMILVRFFQGFSGIYFYGLPDDCFISTVWMRHETHGLCFMLHHPTFKRLENGGMAPKLTPEFRFRFRLEPDEYKMIMYHDPTSTGNLPHGAEYEAIGAYGFAPTEEGDAAETLHTLQGKGKVKST